MGITLFYTAPADFRPAVAGAPAAIAFPTGQRAVVVRGDVTIALYRYPAGAARAGAVAAGGRGERLGSLSLHTAFLRSPCHRFTVDEGDGGGWVTVGKAELDGPHLDLRHRRFSRDFRCLFACLRMCANIVRFCAQLCLRPCIY